MEKHKVDFSHKLNESGEYREPWKIFRIMAEFVEGYQFLSTLEKEVTILGSARTKEKDKYYKIAQELGALLADGKYNTITGGGPGIMEAANRGAIDAGGESIGLNIQLPFEQRVNPYVNKSTAFYYFFTRKVMLTSPAHAFVLFPGGFGTLDEFFEVVNHIDIGKMCPVPTVLVGKEYWGPIVDFLKDKCASHGIIGHEVIDSWHVVETAEEAYEMITSHGREAGVCELSPLNFHRGANDVDWRVFRIMSELVEGFEFLTGMVEDVTVLGTRGLGPDSLYYKKAHDLGAALASADYTVITGGATGIAEAVNKGAMEQGGQSVGIGLHVEGEERMNQYVNKSIMFKFPFTRKLMVTAPSKAFVFFPGGLGTMHHLFEVLTLIQTGKMPKIPIMLFDSEYWGSLDVHIRTMMAGKLKTISPDDPDLYTLVDSVDDVMEKVNTFRNK